MQHKNGAYVLQKAVVRLKQKAEPLVGDRSLLQVEDVHNYSTRLLGARAPSPALSAMREKKIGYGLFTFCACGALWARRPRSQ